MIVGFGSGWLDDIVLIFVSTLLRFGQEYYIYSTGSKTDIPKVVFSDCQDSVPRCNPIHQTIFFKLIKSNLAKGCVKKDENDIIKEIKKMVS